MKVALLGLGIVGSRVREHVLKAGYEVSCWSRTWRGLEGEKRSAREAVEGVEVVSIYLKDAPMVREVFAEVREVLKPGMVVMNHATVDLPTTLWLAEQCASKSCDFLDVPFTGSREAAAGGQLLYYTAGDEELLEKMGEYLAASSKGSIHCGEVGMGTVTKIATNLITACTVQAMSEALSIATKHGVDPAVFVEAATRNTSGSITMAMKFPGILSGNFDPHFSMANMWKDSRYALSLAESAGVDLPAMEVVSEKMGEMCDKGMGEMDFSALAKAYGW